MKKLLPLLLTLFLASCATLPASDQPTNQALSWQQRQQQLVNITSWTIEGALAIKTQNKGETASVHWIENNGQYQISLFGPLGVGRTTLRGDAQHVELLANGKHYAADKPETLMQHIMGWHLPLSNIFYWIRGIPAPNLTYQAKFDDYHHLVNLEQQGWQIQYVRYTSTRNIDLPSELALKRGNLKLKIVISSWKL